MKNVIKQIIKEELQRLNEINNEELNFIKENHPNDRIHMSKDGVLQKNDTTSKLDIGTKPRGLWYGFGSSWIDWVDMEMPEWNYDHIFKINVNPNKVLQINTLYELIQFDNEFSIPHGFYKNIDWKKVSQSYDGIEINPYQYKARMTLNWYYGWDVASGCIWNPNAIINIQKLN